MIDYDGWSNLKVIFSWHGSTLSKTWPNVLVCMMISLVTNVIIEFTSKPTIDVSSHSMPLVFVSILLVFRCGYAFGRYMEGRGHVGKMVFTVRDLARMMATFVVGNDAETNNDRANCVRLIKAFTVSNRLSLRAEEAEGFTELEDYLTNAEAQRLKELKKNFPLTILQWLGQSLAKFQKKQYHARALDTMEEQVGGLMEAWMGMHKLATTPFPFPYAQMCTFFLYLWCYTFPVAIAFEHTWFGFAISTVVAFALFGINAIACELEDPFGTDANDLDLDFFEGGCMAACKALLPPALKPDKAPAPPPSAPASEITPGAPTKELEQPLQPRQDPLGPEKIKTELLAATDISGLSVDVANVFKDMFTRYDLNNSGQIDSQQELTQLVTNLSFELKLGNGLGPLLEKAEGVGDTPNWNLNHFVQWFLTTAKTLPS